MNGELLVTFGSVAKMAEDAPQAVTTPCRIGI